MGADLKKLQNGSDIRGVALEGVKGEAVNLGIEEAAALTAGFVRWLCEKTGKAPETLKVSVGTDSRISRDILRKAVIEALISAGVNVFDCGMASTPAMFMSTVFPEYACDGAIMITASHLPFNRNGFKYFDRDGGLNKQDITQIISYAGADAEADRNRKPGQVTKADLIDTYIKIITRISGSKIPCCPPLITLSTMFPVIIGFIIFNAATRELKVNPVIINKRYFFT